MPRPLYPRWVKLQCIWVVAHSLPLPKPNISCSGWMTAGANPGGGGTWGEYMLPQPILPQNTMNLHLALKASKSLHHFHVPPFFKIVNKPLHSMKEFNIIFKWTIDLGTDTAMRWGALMAQDETAVRHKPQCIPASSGDWTQNGLAEPVQCAATVLTDPPVVVRLLRRGAFTTQDETCVYYVDLSESTLLHLEIWRKKKVVGQTHCIMQICQMIDHDNAQKVYSCSVLCSTK